MWVAGIAVRGGREGKEKQAVARRRADDGRQGDQHARTARKAETGEGRPRAHRAGGVEAAASAPNGGKPDKLSGLTTDATDPGVAAVPGAGGAGRDGGVRAPAGVPSPAAGGGTGSGKRPERATTRAARAALASARDLGGIRGSVAKSEMKKRRRNGWY